MASTDCHKLVAIHQVTFFIHRKHTVCIAIKCKGQRLLFFFINNPCLKFFHMGGTAVGIDIGSIGLRMDSNQICTQVF